MQVTVNIGPQVQALLAKRAELVSRIQKSFTRAGEASEQGKEFEQLSQSIQANIGNACLTALLDKSPWASTP